MIKKRKTVKFQNNTLPLKSIRNSLPNIHKYLPIDRTLETMIKQIIDQYITNVEEIAQFNQKVTKNYHNILSLLQTQQQKYFNLSSINMETKQFVTCENQPIQIEQSVKPENDWKPQFNKQRSRLRLERRRDHFQSCDIKESLKKKEKYHKQFEQLKKCTNNELISINQNIRISESEDHSMQIQELLRRKKQLQLQTKQLPRTYTEISKAISLQKKQKKNYFQDDEGELVQIAGKNPIKLQKLCPITNLANIKVVPGQHIFLQTSMKKKPILELPTTRRTKKRKEIGDTCILIEQLYSFEPTDQLDQQMAIQKMCEGKKGINFLCKQKSLTTVVKLPSLR